MSGPQWLRREADYRWVTAQSLAQKAKHAPILEIGRSVLQEPVRGGE
jgi:hypothetical protein